MIKLLVIHAGGTFGMVKEGGCYIVRPRELEQNVRKNAELNSGKSGRFMFSVEGKAVISYEILELEIKDSSNAEPKDYVNLIHALEGSYSSYDAFVVIHGTDTITYTATTVSFMIENLSKPVIFTGSMIPMFRRYTDAVANLSGAFRALLGNIRPAVYIFFNGKLLPANRATKTNASELDAYSSTSTASSPVPSNGMTKFYYKLAEDILLLRAHPFMDPKAVDVLFSSCRAVVIEGYGCGNIPDALLNIVKFHSENENVLVVIVSQCLHGRVSGCYQSANLLLSCKNVINGEDMSTEAALGKLSFLLGNFAFADAKRLLRKNLRGEITFQQRDSE